MHVERLDSAQWNDLRKGLREDKRNSKRVTRCGTPRTRLKSSSEGTVCR